MSGGFYDFGLCEELLRAISEQGWDLPTDVQDEAIPLILGGGDVMGASETGSGKTAAFSIPILQCVYERIISSKGNDIRSPSALVILPTVNLAEQVYNSFVDLAKYIEPRVGILLLTSGGGSKHSFQSSKKGYSNTHIDIIIGTHGTLSSSNILKEYDFQKIHFFILDEADQLASPDNISSIMKIFNHLPKNGQGIDRLQVCFFSATLHSKEILSLSQNLCVNPTWVDLKGQDTISEYVKHCTLPIPIEKFEEVVNNFLNSMKMTLNSFKYSSIVPHDTVHLEDVLFAKKSKGNIAKSELDSLKLKIMKPIVLKHLIDKFNMNQCMIFCRTNLDCINLGEFFEKINEKSKKNGLESPYTFSILRGKMPVNDRIASLKNFKEGETRFLISTDVGARGIDIASLPYIINMTLPDDPAQYFHRIGRVGRNQTLGLAISIIPSGNIGEKVWFHKLCKDPLTCLNRDLLETGGCTIWYNEEKELKKIVTKVGSNISEMEFNVLSLPSELEPFSSKFGEYVGNINQSSVKINENMKNEVANLINLEYEAQNIFLTKFI